MKKENFGSLLLGKWDTKTIVTVAIGAALFGVLMNYGSIPIFTNTSLTTAMIVPVVVGAMYGPLPAAVACGVGNVIADLIGGWGIYPAWAIANFVAGLFVGALPLYGARVTEGKFDVKHMIWYAICVVVGNAIAFGVIAQVFTVIFEGGDMNVSLIQGVYASVGNILIELVIGLPVIYMLAKRYAGRSNLTEE
ncbi:MAG: ECF-type riboflavin transporter substrate-binding protein [Erysipelotrichaceae bacterium]|nr:ECF-type riboflavin transporter substrate-binding protein [Erysipelotrichaceae bacterium]